MQLPERTIVTSVQNPLYIAASEPQGSVNYVIRVSLVCQEHGPIIAQEIFLLFLLFYEKEVRPEKRRLRVYVCCTGSAVATMSFCRMQEIAL